MPKVSVIVPNYNHARFLRQRLDSIFNQTYQDYEVIILDDASTDNSLEILEKYAKKPKVSHFIVNEKNSGSPFMQWKRGIDLAQGEYIWVTESDDWAENEFLDKTLNHAIINDLGLVFTNSRLVDENGNPIDFETKQWSSAHSEKGILYGNSFTDGNQYIKCHLVFNNSIPNGSAVIFKKSLVNLKSSAFKLRFAGDWLLWLQIANQGKIGFIDSVLNNFRKHTANRTDENDYFLRRDCLLVLKYARRFVWKTPSLYKNLLKSYVLWILKEFIWEKEYSFSPKRIKDIFLLVGLIRR